MSLDTTNWVKYPFSVDGVDFVSMLDPKGDFYPQIEELPADVFISWNTEMVNSVIGNPSLMSRDELVSELERVNDGATQAILALA
jgi:hypothetical protein